MNALHKLFALSLLVVPFAVACAADADDASAPAQSARASAPVAGTPAKQASDRSDPPTDRRPDVVYVPTPQPVVDAMLQMAKVGPDDVLYDLGSGDGRIPITAAKTYGIRAVGIDIDPERIREAKANVAKAGVGDRVEIRQGDLFEEDIGDASVVTLYLLESLNLKLRPKLLSELKPGTRIVSHAFGMGDWKPEATRVVDGDTLYLWIVPERGAAAGEPQ